MLKPLAPSISDNNKEKTTKTTATYYPKISREASSIIATTTRKESIVSTASRDELSPKKDILSSLGKSGYESESGDEEFKSPQSVPLKPYSHQVGGHSALFRFSRHAVCKPLIEKENAFYQDVEINRPERPSLLSSDYADR